MATIIYGFSPPTGFDSDEPVRLRIMGVIATRLAALTVANGYHYEMASVVYGQQLRAEPYPEHQVYFFDQDETRDDQKMGGGEYKSLVVEVEAITMLTDPVDPAEVAAIAALTDLAEQEQREIAADRQRSNLIARTSNFMLADVQRAMFEDPLLRRIDPECGGLADGMSYESSVGTFGMKLHLWAGNTSQWVINYHSVRGKPHLVQEET